MITGGLSMQMVVLASLTVKPLLDGVLFPDHLVGVFLSCLVPSLPLSLIWLSLVPELSPTTPLK